MAGVKNAILLKMLDRLFAGLTSGPNLNCRPHSSRQRVDWTQFARLKDLSPAEALGKLFTAKPSIQLRPQIEPPAKPGKSSDGRGKSRSRSDAKRKLEQDSSPEEMGQLPPVPTDSLNSLDEWSNQQSLLTKLRGLAEDARAYEQDTGVHVLHVGFPLLSVPPSAAGNVKSFSSGGKRLLAPIAFISVSLEVRAGFQPVISIEGRNDGADALVPNEALFAWLERQSGQSLLANDDENTSPTEVLASPPSSASEPGEIDSATTSSQQQDLGSGRTTTSQELWEELNSLVSRVTRLLQLPESPLSAASLENLRKAPRSDDENPRAEIVLAAVLGLFPMNKQGLLRDMQAMVEQSTFAGPLQSFLTLDPDLPSLDDDVSPDLLRRSRTAVPAAANRLISAADPFQSKAVRLARDCSELIIHGPPGTGKSQTITNIIGDHLVRGERVLLVCDKRTALDVVASRLEHLGLGSLCSLIHDPQHDQRILFNSIRKRLESLTENSRDGMAQARLDSLDAQVQKGLDQLWEAWRLTMDRDPQRATSFHERMGDWLEAIVPTLETANFTWSATEPQSAPSANRPSPDTSRSDRGRTRPRRRGSEASAETVTLSLYESHETVIRDLVSRASSIDFSNHPWRRPAGITLTELLQTPQDQIREDLKVILDCALTVDDAKTGGIPSLDPLGWIAPSSSEADHEGEMRVEGKTSSGTISGGKIRSKPGRSFHEQAHLRRELAARMRRCVDSTDGGLRGRWAKSSKSILQRSLDRLLQIEPEIEVTRLGLLDAQFLNLIRSTSIPISQQLHWTVDLGRYLATCTRWYGWFAFRSRSRASTILREFGLPLSPPNATRVHSFLTQMTARNTVATCLNEVSPAKPPRKVEADSLTEDWDQLCQLLQILLELENAPLSDELKQGARQSLNDGNEDWIESLVTSSEVADSLEELRDELVGSRLFSTDWLNGFFERVCSPDSVVDELRQLETSVDQLADVLRILESLQQLPAGLRRITEEAIEHTGPCERILSSIRQKVLAAEISAWLAANPALLQMDGPGFDKLSTDVIALQQKKQAIVRDVILDYWTQRQRQKLLAMTGTRLNSAGADLRRRLTTRGERAMRLRQVITTGQQLPGGDPLFDLCPVWMVSPETVAQIFPREPLFDVVIFDEASQCRLEEALPVLTRARRVVIAGDPKQLPPSRFFESTVTSSDQSLGETEQELFESHQSEVEDLLSAALSLNLQECYLDVHYRSRNADLVQFSNDQFYSSRLQVIPGHPRNRVRFAPITLYQVNGVFEDRANSAEADRVCQIVEDLLRRSEPPSIGIACFNLTQRDLILERLDELAVKDADFAHRLAAARCRSGQGTFEGLFVKNLENVQGDERDHMIISTTYGVDSQGRFYRRFGPLGQAGGGRRLNVLITRAREEVHLVTSIPVELYRSLPPVPAGQQPGGGWLLFAYLAFAERLSEDYNRWRESPSDNDSPTGLIVESPTQTPSRFARAFAGLAARRNRIGSDLYRGNDGFCIDVAFHHPSRREDRTLGIIFDVTRFTQADDPVEWELFRTQILEGQGWQLRRCWTPEFFRDPVGEFNKILAEADELAETDEDPESIPVE
ncbi:AAA domain-containing protein [Schlesneria sp. T3-172]|uniref:AAA domain-containing protein n=1 Tax=Schlesneria sphaerica TaxID=3373610 RepID=UPI0037CC4D24